MFRGKESMRIKVLLTVVVVLIAASIPLVVQGQDADTSPPKLTIRVFQEGVKIDNLVGNKYEGGVAHVVIEANEEISLGDVIIMGDNRSLLPPLFMTTPDNKTFIGSFEVGEWDDMYTVVKVTNASDLAGNMITDVEQPFVVDTRPPVFLDDGLSDLLASMVQIVQAGTGNIYWASNKLEHTIRGRVQDNCTSIRLGWRDNATAVEKVIAEWNGKSAVFEHVPRYYDEPSEIHAFDDSFELNITFSQGPASLNITAIDWTGNSVSVGVENIFIDTDKPIIRFDMITGVDYDKKLEEGVYVNDNTPTVTLTVKDPGYPDTGLGMSYENLGVYLDDDGDLSNNYICKLESETWNSSTGLFESTCPELVDGTYYIIVVTNDGLNENMASVSFVVDTEKPTISSEPLTATVELGSRDNPTVTYKTALKLTGECEPGAAITVLVNGNVRATTVATTGLWSAEARLMEGLNEIQVQAIDLAGNKETVTYGYVICDTTSPTAEITSPVTGFITANSTILVEGRAVDEVSSVIEVMLNGETVSLNPDGTFSKSVALHLGTNTLTLLVKDEAGHYAMDTIVIISDTAAPIVLIDEPSETITTNQESITITGRVCDLPPETGVEVSMNMNGVSQEVTIDENGKFSVSVPLTDGENVISITAVDEAGNVGSATIKIIRTAVTAIPYETILASVALIIAIVDAIIIYLYRRRAGKK